MPDSMEVSKVEKEDEKFFLVPRKYSKGTRTKYLFRIGKDSRYIRTKVVEFENSSYLSTKDAKWLYENVTGRITYKGWTDTKTLASSTWEQQDKPLNFNSACNGEKMKISFGTPAPSVAVPVKPKVSLVVPKEIELASNPDGGQYVPKKEFFLDTGIMKPLKIGILHNKPVLLKGETGVGKTSSVRFLAGETNNNYRRINLNGGTTTDEFVGRWKLNKDKEMVWIDGVLVDAMVNGHWLVCDEINACLPEITFVLHSVLDDDRMIVMSAKDGGIVKPHANFRFFATMNPDYAGTNSLNVALENRFPLVINVDYPTRAQEIKILTTKTKQDKGLLGKMVMVASKSRMSHKNEDISTPVSTRALLDWAGLMDNGMTVDEACGYAILNKMNKEDREHVLDIADQIFAGSSFKKTLKV